MADLVAIGGLITGSAALLLSGVSVLYTRRQALAAEEAVPALVSWSLRRDGTEPTDSRYVLKQNGSGTATDVIVEVLGAMMMGAGEAIRTPGTSRLEASSFSLR